MMLWPTQFGNVLQWMVPFGCHPATVISGYSKESGAEIGFCIGNWDDSDGKNGPGAGTVGRVL